MKFSGLDLLFLTTEEKHMNSDQMKQMPEEDFLALLIKCLMLSSCCLPDRIFGEGFDEFDIMVMDAGKKKREMLEIISELDLHIDNQKFQKIYGYVRDYMRNETEKNTNEAWDDIKNMIKETIQEA